MVERWKRYLDDGDVQRFKIAFDEFYHYFEERTLINPAAMQSFLTNPNDPFGLSFQRTYHNRCILEPLSAYTERAARAYCMDSGYYAPYFSFIQSSGMGKSRSLFEMGSSNHLMIYCCVRPANSSGYPFATHDPKFFQDWDVNYWVLYLCTVVRTMVETWRQKRFESMRAWMVYHVTLNIGEWANRVSGNLNAMAPDEKIFIHDKPQGSLGCYNFRIFCECA
jgi:hypothetical protein